MATPKTLIICGNPVVLKNSKRIMVTKRRRFVMSSKKVEAYRPQALLQLWKQWGHHPPITAPINLIIRTFGAWKRASENLPDASNLYQMPEDLLQSAGIILDDRQVESHDGSERICLCDTCEERPVYKSGPRKGKRWPDCGAVKKCKQPRVEITIEILAKGD